MRRVKDLSTLDLFEIPEPHLLAPGECAYNQEVARLVSEMLNASSLIDRHSISADISRLSGKDVSKHMLDAYASPARIDHTLPFWMVPVLEDICSSHALTNWLVMKRGGRAAYGKEALKQELGKLVSLKKHAMKDMNTRIKHIETLLGGE